ncbi:MAG: hypothetical protein KME64_37665 [Scytonematopsis contorta HA4267-MV1]|jgi:hypothetical protein|nr:hypothetical protein [Scytonematopsis contorta HA4267-MV1]
MKLRYLAGFGLISFCTITQPVSAGIIRRVPASQLNGENAQLKTVKVWNGHGVSISFYRTGETIKKIWLDDPSRFVLDVDGCLEGLGKCEKGKSGAGLIHLRKINRVNIPGLPSATNGAHLTVITESGSNRKSYHFRIVPGKGQPEYSQIEIIGDASRRDKKPKGDYTAQSDSKYIRKGMQIALRNKWANSNSELWGKLNQIVELRAQGEELTAAANKAGVSMQVVEKLMELGGKRLLEFTPRRNRPSNPPPITADERNIVHSK